jgi:hypothetical protein
MILMTPTLWSAGSPHKDILDRLLLVLRAIVERYANVGILVYGDFNMPRNEFEVLMADRLRPVRFMGHFQSGEGVATRIQSVAGKVQSSYLDYLVSRAVEFSHFEIKEAIGNSDHLGLKARFKLNGIKLAVSRQLMVNFGKLRQEDESVFEDMRKALWESSPLDGILNMYPALKDHFKPRIKKVKNMFQIGPELAKLVEDKNWAQIRRLALKSSREEYKIFMKKFEEFDLDRKDREYF